MRENQPDAKESIYKRYFNVLTQVSIILNIILDTNSIRTGNDQYDVLKSMLFSSNYVDKILSIMIIMKKIRWFNHFSRVEFVVTKIINYFRIHLTFNVIFSIMLYLESFILTLRYFR